MTGTVPFDAALGDHIVKAAVIDGAEVAVVAIVFGVAGSVMIPIVRAFAKRIEATTERRSTALPAEAVERLERIERAVEAVAIEVERISENQRFVTQVLNGREPGGRLGAGGSPGDAASH